MSGIYLTCMGEIYRISKRGYRSYLKEVALDGMADITKHGATLIQNKTYNITDIKREEAQLILDGGRCSWLPTLK